MANMTAAMPAQMQQFMLQLAQTHPELLAQAMASTGAEPPVNQVGNRMTGVPAMGATPSAVASGQTAGLPLPPPAAMPSGDPAALAAALGGAIAPTAAGPMPAGPPSPPGAPGIPGPAGFKPGVMELMQALMAQQQAAPQMNLGRQIAGG